MALSKWGYFRESVHRAWHGAWHGSHWAYWALTLIAGFGSVLLGFHLEKQLMIWIPLIVFIALVVVGLFYHAYHVYLESETGRESAVEELATIRTPKVELIGGVEVGEEPGGFERVFWVRVRNASGGTIRGCGVRWAGSDMRFSCNPHRLCHENAESKTVSADLTPGDDARFELCRVMGSQLVVYGPDVCIAAMQKGTFTIRVIGDGTAALEQVVVVDPDDERQVLFAPSGSA